MAKDLGFDGRELTDMLERLPVEEPFETEMEADEENLLSNCIFLLTLVITIIIQVA